MDMERASYATPRSGLVSWRLAWRLDLSSQTVPRSVRTWPTTKGSLASCTAAQSPSSLTFGSTAKSCVDGTTRALRLVLRATRQTKPAGYSTRLCFHLVDVCWLDR